VGEEPSLEQTVIRKAAWRLVPFMGLLYLASFLDRVNIGVAALTMNSDLAFSATVFGNGAGIFFLGYVLFEVPSNLVLYKVGARRWICRIMISWGVLSAATAFIHSPGSFYAIRFLLGVAEAGFFPGIIFYLTDWFPSHYRGRILGAFMVALPLASAIGAPISGALLDLDAGGLKGWQWLFILEGAPAIGIGLMVLKLLTDRPEKALWLSAAERECLIRLQTVDKAARTPLNGTLAHAVHSTSVWLYSAIYFALLVGLYGFNFWLPQIIQGGGRLSHREIGVLTMLPNLVAAALMYGWGRHSDTSAERRWHMALPAFLAATGFFAAAHWAASPILALVALTIGAVSVYVILPVFWTLPTGLLRGAAAAGGIALINAVGNFGGYLGSTLMGRLKDATGDYRLGLCVLALSLLVTGVLALFVRNQKVGAEAG